MSWSVARDLRAIDSSTEMWTWVRALKRGGRHDLEHYNDISLSREFSEFFSFVDLMQFSGFGAVQNVDLTDLYTIALPSTLVSLSIQWTSDPNAGVVSDLVAAKDNLIQRLPDLCHLWLCDFSKRAISWSRTAPRAEERLTLHEGE